MRRASSDMAMQLAVLGEKVRHLKASGLEEGVSTRLLIYAGELIRQGITPRRAATVAVTWSLTDENDSKRAIDEIVKAIFRSCARQNGENGRAHHLARG